MRFRAIPSVFIALIICFGVFADEKKGFRFQGGDIENGSEVFAGLNCVQCHSVNGVYFEQPVDKRLEVMLAGEERFVKKYEDIITAISNPKHVVMKQYEGLMSKTELESLSAMMEDFTGRMTLRQFMDLVAFLDRAYSQKADYYKNQLQESR